MNQIMVSFCLKKILNVTFFLSLNSLALTRVDEAEKVDDKQQIMSLKCQDLCSFA